MTTRHGQPDRILYIQGLGPVIQREVRPLRRLGWVLDGLLGLLLAVLWAVIGALVIWAW